MIHTRPMTRAEIAARDGGRNRQPVAPTTAQKIADDMIDIAAGKGPEGCAEERDLILRGWEPEQLAEHAAAANRIARARARQDR